ncbi:MAG TPA: hypothetical protein DHW38_05135 [Planctomycetaceae bacterium]|nr:hypothetical protein [Planctomycetaceae bacterium]HCP85895.1 hypothetical protein [Planctomycetaceae bacterium]
MKKLLRFVQRFRILNSRPMRCFWKYCV